MSSWIINELVKKGMQFSSKNFMVLGPKARLRPTSCVAEGHYWVAEGHDIEPVRVPTIHEVDQSTGEALVLIILIK